MAKKGGLGRGLSEMMAETPHTHPLLSALTFEHLTKATGGSTMNLKTGELIDTSNPAKDTYVVGGEPDVKGNRIPTKLLSNPNTSPMFLKQVLQQRRALVKKTGDRPGASMGSWLPAGAKQVDLDASGIEPDLAKAMDKARVRNEKAIWSTKKFRKSGKKFDGDILNPSYKAE